MDLTQEIINKNLDFSTEDPIGKELDLQLQNLCLKVLEYFSDLPFTLRPSKLPSTYMYFQFCPFSD